MKISYKVYPSYTTVNTNEENCANKIREAKNQVKAPNTILMICGISWWIVIFANLTVGVLLLVAGIIIHFAVLKPLQNKISELTIELEQIQTANSNAILFSKQLNELLEKSEEIVSEILPHFNTLIKKSLDVAQNDFNDNAISPFWDNIEDACKYLALYKEGVEQLILNGELYTNTLDGKKHNFPLPFPINTNVSISQMIYDEYSQLIRKAQSKFEFANIWEHRKTQKILLAGFKTLEQAINNMSAAIVHAIADLKNSMKSGFRELKYIQLEQLRSNESNQRLMNNTLSEMNNKLYYIQYHKSPTTPFTRPLFGD